MENQRYADAADPRFAIEKAPSDVHGGLQRFQRDAP